MTKTEQRINELLKEFAKLEQWEERYKYIIELGKGLPPMDSSLQTEENKVRGCQSQVWLSVSLTSDKKLHFVADSDALIVKGLIAILLFVYQDLAPDEILKTSTHFLVDLGFAQHLSPSRANGLQAMAKQIHYFAKAYQVLLTRQI